MFSRDPNYLTQAGDGRQSAGKRLRLCEMQGLQLALPVGFALHVDSAQYSAPGKYKFCFLEFS